MDYWNMCGFNKGRIRAGADRARAAARGQRLWQKFPRNFCQRTAPVTRGDTRHPERHPERQRTMDNAANHCYTVTDRLPTNISRFHGQSFYIDFRKLWDSNQNVRESKDPLLRTHVHRTRVQRCFSFSALTCTALAIACSDASPSPHSRAAHSRAAMLLLLRTHVHRTRDRVQRCFSFSALTCSALACNDASPSPHSRAPHSRATMLLLLRTPAMLISALRCCAYHGSPPALLCCAMLLPTMAPRKRCCAARCFSASPADPNSRTGRSRSTTPTHSLGIRPCRMPDFRTFAPLAGARHIFPGLSASSTKKPRPREPDIGASRGRA